MLFASLVFSLAISDEQILPLSRKLTKSTISKKGHLFQLPKTLSSYRDWCNIWVISQLCQFLPSTI